MLRAEKRVELSTERYVTHQVKYACTKIKTKVRVQLATVERKVQNWSNIQLTGEHGGSPSTETTHVERPSKRRSFRGSGRSVSEMRCGGSGSREYAAAAFPPKSGLPPGPSRLLFNGIGRSRPRHSRTLVHARGRSRNSTNRTHTK
ncbi:unnamed protein product [Ixodes pacificus]